MLGHQALDLLPVGESDFTHIHHPEVSGCMSHRCPENIFLCLSWGSKFLHIVSSECDFPVRSILVGQENTEDWGHLSLSSRTSKSRNLLDERGKSADIACWTKPHNATKLILVDIRGLIDSQEHRSV